MKPRLRWIAALCIFLAACDQEQQETRGGSSESGNGETKAPSNLRTPRIRDHEEKQAGQKDLLTALEIETPDEQQRAVAEIAWNAIETDPSLAAAAFDKLTLNSEVRLELIIYFALQKAEESLEDAMAWAHSLESDLEKSTALGQVAMVIADTDPRRAATLISESAIEGRQSDVAVVQVLQRWSAQDPQGAAAWVISFPPGEARLAGLRATLNTWAETDPPAALAWISTVGTPELRSEITLAMAETLALQDEETRETWLKQADLNVREEIQARMKEALKNSGQEP